MLGIWRRGRGVGAGRSATSGVSSARVRAVSDFAERLVELVGVEPAGGRVGAERLGDVFALGV